MEEIKIRQITAKCPECSADYAIRWDDLSEEQQCMRGFFCPKCGAFVSFAEGGAQ